MIFTSTMGNEMLDYNLNNILIDLDDTYLYDNEVRIHLQIFLNIEYIQNY